MKRIQLGLAGVVMTTVLLQVGCANLPQSSTGSAPQNAQALQEEASFLAIAGLPPKTKVIPLGKMGDALPGLKPDQVPLFTHGKAMFEKPFQMEAGDFANERSCVACHGAGGSGGASDRFAQNVGFITDPLNEGIVAAGQPSAGFLGHLLSADPAFPKQLLPVAPAGSKVVVSARLAPPTAGDGVLMAIPESQLHARAAQQNASLGISGRVGIGSFIPGVTFVGRIGWKLRTPTLSSFTAGAFINELGVSNSALAGIPLEQHADGSLQPDPNGPDISNADLAAVAHFQELSIPPAPHKVDLAGLAAFKKAGCIECHWTGYTTAKTMDELPDDLKPFSQVFLGGMAVPAYTDLLAHNMGGGTLTETVDLTGQGPVYRHLDGKGNSDGISESVASNEYRTAPLWGLRFRPLFMHDGRAKTIDEAIRQHYYVSPTDSQYDSEANQVVLNYLGKGKKGNLTPFERAALLGFLRQL